MYKRVYPRNSIAYRKRKAKITKRQRIIFGGGAIILILLIVLLVVLLQSCSSERGLVGKWSIDGVTLYEFEENGKGAMIVPSKTYPFTYTKKDNKIKIDFESEFAVDKTYTYEVKKNTLILEGEGKFGGVYTMTRIHK